MEEYWSYDFSSPCAFVNATHDPYYLHFRCARGETEFEEVGAVADADDEQKEDKDDEIDRWCGIR